MTTAPAILEIGALLLGAAAAGWVARRIGLPAVIGFLALGVGVSPFTPGYIADPRQLQLLADVGVVLLLFEVGIEVDLRRLRREHGALAWAGPLQVVITTGVAGGVIAATGLPVVTSLVLGLAIALSSSVVIVNITRSRRRTTDRPTEVILLGWSVVQDVTGVVLASILLAMVEGERRPLIAAVAGFAAFGALAVVTAVLLPRVLRAIREQPDLFLLVSVASGLVLAGVGAVAFDVPLALAAFIGGLAITEDPVAAEARRRLLPFRDVFAVLFFVAVGTLLDPHELAGGLGWLALFLGLIVTTKVGVTYVLARAARISHRPLQLAVGLGQVGEFSFVLGAALAATAAIGSQIYVALIAAVAISIAVTTVAVRLVPATADPGEPTAA